MEALLDKYADEGIENIESMKVLQVKPLSDFGSTIEIVNGIFGSRDKCMAAVKELEKSYMKYRKNNHDKVKKTMEEINKNSEGFIPKHGGYRKLITYQKGEIIYDGTVYFTKRFLHKYDRTIDQMVQAARSGKQNIAEASMASGTSKETEKTN